MGAYKYAGAVAGGAGGMAVGLAVGSIAGPVGAVVGTLIGGFVGRYKGKKFGTKIFQDMEDKKERQKNDPQYVAKQREKTKGAEEFRSDDDHANYDVEFVKQEEESKGPQGLTEEQKLKSYLKNLRLLGVKDSYTDEQILKELQALKEGLKSGDILFNEG
jgi:hypothetical protein